jgi:ribonucleotide monophosphatase NagD (HAD superfamily)
VIIGKPQPHIFELALQKLEADLETAAIVGDRLDTDILGGHQLGLTTVLVLSGVTDPQQLASSSLTPDLVYGDIATFHHAWRDAVAVQNG